MMGVGDGVNVGLGTGEGLCVCVAASVVDVAGFTVASSVGMLVGKIGAAGLQA